MAFVESAILPVHDRHIRGKSQEVHTGDQALKDKKEAEIAAFTVADGEDWDEVDLSLVTTSKAAKGGGKPPSSSGADSSAGPEPQPVKNEPALAVALVHHARNILRSSTARLRYSHLLATALGLGASLIIAPWLGCCLTVPCVFGQGDV